MELGDMPDELLHNVLSHLEPRGLASFAVQCRRFKTLVSESSVWERHCFARWKGVCLVPETEGKVLSWAAVYRHRAELPPDLLLAADAAYSYSADILSPRAQAGVRQRDNWQGRGEFYSFEVAMKALFRVGVEAGRDAGVLRNPVVARLRKVLCGWLSLRQDVAVAFARHAHEGFLDYDMWTNSYRGWQEVPWRRSALEFLPRLVGSGVGPWEHASVLEALSREAAKLDAAVRRLQAEGASLESKPQEGVPRSHWWWFLRGAEGELEE